MTINVDSTSTIKVMQWIKENNCIELFNCIFSAQDRAFLIVSSMSYDAIKNVIIASELNPDYWFEYNGMFRHMTKFGWVFKIDDNYYFANEY